jgi:biopolymer transport protein ExbB
MRLIPIRFLMFFVLCVVTAIRVAAADQQLPPPDAGMTLWDYMIVGGWCMWPLAGCLLVMFVLTIHCARETRRARFIPDALLPQLRAALEQRRVDDARALLADNRTVLGRVFHNALEVAKPELPDANKSRLESAIAERIEHEDGALNQWVNYLNVVATIAPMIGLLGTVSGMIGAFQTIGAGGMGRPELLAGDIGEALITTAAGLIIGIPAMIAYYIFRNRLADQIMATVQAATRLVDHLVGETSRENANLNEVTPAAQ